MNRVRGSTLAANKTYVPSAERQAELACRWIAAALGEAVSRRGNAAIAVPGGRSPLSTLLTLSDLPLNWSRIWVTLTDERWVEPSSSGSNALLVRQTLLRGQAGKAWFAPMYCPERSPELGIGRYLNLLRSLPDRLDVVLLGLGEDGHFASLFPRSPALKIGLDPDSRARCVAVPAGPEGQAPAQARMSLTLAEIIRAENIILLSQGRAKDAIISRALDQVCNPHDLPLAALLAHRPDTAIIHCP